MLFRKEALKKLSSPEQLDEAIIVTSPMTWALVAVLIFAVGASLAWSMLGAVYTRVTGPAFIVYDEPEIAEIVATGSGTLVQIEVQQGDHIFVGSILADLSNPGLAARLTQARRIANEFQEIIKKYEAARDSELVEYDRLQSQRRATLETRLGHVEESTKAFQERLKNREDLFSRGATNVTAVDDMRTLYFKSRQDIDIVKDEIERLSLERQEKATLWKQKILDLGVRHTQQMATVHELEHELELTEKIRSPRRGEVSEVLAPLGAHVSTGQVLFTVVRPRAELEALGFLSAADAKLVKLGMRVQISPSTAKKEEYGTIVGYVKEVSNFPMSTEALFAILRNRELAATFSRSGAPLVVKIEFEHKDGKIVWSSNSPPPFELSAGTLAVASVVVHEQAPITLLLPTLKRWFGLQ